MLNQHINCSIFAYAQLTTHTKAWRVKGQLQMAIKQKMRLNWQVVGRWTQTFGGSYFFPLYLFTSLENVVLAEWTCCIHLIPPGLGLAWLWDFPSLIHYLPFCEYVSTSAMPFCYSCHAIIWLVLDGSLLGLLYVFTLLNSSGLVLSLG